MLRWKLSLLLSLPLVLPVSAMAQAGSMADLRADEQRLHQQQLQLDQDRDRLRFDRSHRAPRSVISADEQQIRNDRAVIRSLKADIKHDRRLRRRYRQGSSLTNHFGHEQKPQGTGLCLLRHVALGR